MNVRNTSQLTPIPNSSALSAQNETSGNDQGNHDDRASETARLFNELNQHQCPRMHEILHEDIIRLNMGVARSLARRYSGRGETTADLEQVAYLGLVKAVQGFKAEKGHNFLSYAVPTITGEIKRHFRDHCWTVKPPRQIQELQRHISQVRQEFLQAQSEEPSVAELADTLGETREHVNEALATRGCFAPQSLDKKVATDHHTTIGDLIADEKDDLELADTHVLVSELIATLPSDDQRIITLRFFEGHTQDHIARELGVSQMHVSRRLSKLIKHMREELAPENALLAS